jgi:hypothetical protein
VCVFHIPSLQVQDMHQSSEVDGVLNALGPAELTLLAVALIPMHRLEMVIKQVGEQVKRTMIRNKV